MTSYGRKAERPAFAHALAQGWASAEPRSFPDNTGSSPKKLRLSMANYRFAMNPSTKRPLRHLLTWMMPTLKDITNPFSQNTRAIVRKDDSCQAGVMMNVPPCVIDSTGRTSWRSYRGW
jgi:hypothetical protein